MGLATLPTLASKPFLLRMIFIIFASLTIANGLLFDGQGKTFEVRDQSNGNLLFSYTFPSNSIKGAITILNGMVYVPSVDDTLYVFGL